VTRRGDRAGLGRSSAAPLHDLDAHKTEAEERATARGVVLSEDGPYTGGLTEAILRA